MAMKLEVIVLPVADVDRAKAFYLLLGFRLDADLTASSEYRVVQLTPPESECSIIFGTGVTSAVPGSVQGLHLVVTDIDATRAELIRRDIDVREVFHDASGVFHQLGTQQRVPGRAPAREDYKSFATSHRSRRQRLGAARSQSSRT